jgi:predicted transcriptional regulator
MKKERLTIVLDPEIRRKIKIRAAEKDSTVSEIVENYIRDLLEKEELAEDKALYKLAVEREKTYSDEQSLEHDQVWE